MNALISKLLGCATLAFASTGASATVIVTDSTYRDFDGSSDHVVFDVGTHGIIGDLDVTVEFSKCDNPYIDPQGRACIGKGSPYENEIVIRLIGPEGRLVRLVNENTFDEGTTGIGRITMTFDDEGAALGRRVQAGAFRPVESLSRFDGMDMFGQWKLYLEDTMDIDPLEVFSSRLVFSPAAAAPPAKVPEPGSLAILGAGLLALSALPRRRA